MSGNHKAKRLPKQPGPAGWNRLLPEPPPATVLSEARSADIAIVGAGIAGLSAARRLLQIEPGLQIVVLEAGRVGDGPAGRNSGFMIDLPHDLSSDSYAGATKKDREETALNRHAIAFASDAAREYAFADDVFNLSGKVNAAASAAGDRHNTEYAAHLKSMEESHRLLDSKEMAALTGTQFYRSGLFTPGTAILQPAAYIRGLAAGLKDTVSIFEDSPVHGMNQQNGEWALTTPKATVHAERVILATNGHAESFGFFKRRLLHVFTYASMTQAFDENLLGGEKQWGATPADPMGTTVRRIATDRGSRIIVRSRFTYNPSMTVSDGGLASAGELHDKKFAERFPMLRDVEMEYCWAGHLCLSLNGVAAHGEVERGLFSAVCQNGLGLAKGTLSGISAAELAMNRDTDITRAFLNMEPPRKLPPEPFTWLGANSKMRWKEWCAGSE